MKVLSLMAAIPLMSSLTNTAFAENPPPTPKLKPADFKEWILPATPPAPENNKPTPERVALGKMLFFDPRVSNDNTKSCASCHSPMFGWSDGQSTARGHKSKLLGRASPTVVNVAYNTIQMWDGRKKDLEDQAMGPLESSDEMNTDLDKFFAWMSNNQQYKQAFANAYPGEPVGPKTFSKAIASYERTVISRHSPFDRWLQGDKKAMSPQQLRGMAFFMDKNKGNCASCHSAPNFTDNGFHNLGLASYQSDNPDMGRYAIKPVAVNKGAFKTPTLRDVERTAPYFHDGSAKTLLEVIEHYEKGGMVKTDLAPGMKPLNMTQSDKEDLLAFLKALSSPIKKVTFPALPLD